MLLLEEQKVSAAAGDVALASEQLRFARTKHEDLVQRLASLDEVACFTLFISFVLTIQRLRLQHLKGLEVQSMAVSQSVIQAPLTDIDVPMVSTSSACIEEVPNSSAVHPQTTGDTFQMDIVSASASNQKDFSGKRSLDEAFGSSGSLDQKQPSNNGVAAENGNRDENSSVPSDKTDSKKIKLDKLDDSENI